MGGNVKVESGGLHFFFDFHSPFDLCSIFLFLELRNRVRVTVTSNDIVRVTITSHMTYGKT